MSRPISGVSIHEKGYPRLLKEIPGAPERFFFLGSPSAWERPLVSIVGTRKATAEGIAVARGLGERFARAGVGVVSGLALGIDGAAHEGALRGNGVTIAVLANGLGEIYPRTHESLAARILEHEGAILSEYPEGTPAYPAQFLERNRIVSGLSLATVVVEAPERSGALSTARHALEQGREVFVFPGSAGSPNYRGNHWLIREGARLAASFAHLEEDLSSLFSEISPPLPTASRNAGRDADSSTVLSALIGLGGGAKTEAIIAASGLDPQAALSALAFLTIEGEVEETEGGFCIHQ